MDCFLEGIAIHCWKTNPSITLFQTSSLKVITIYYYMKLWRADDIEPNFKPNLLWWKRACEVCFGVGMVSPNHQQIRVYHLYIKSLYERFR